MQDIKDYIQERASECEKRSVIWENRIHAYEEKMLLCDDKDKMQKLKFEREQCNVKKKELLAVSYFCKELLYQYFD